MTRSIDAPRGTPLGVVARVDDVYRRKARSTSIEDMITIKKSFQLPPGRRNTLHFISLHTGIRVFGGVSLRGSVLNRPVALVGGVLSTDKSIDIEYKMGDEDGFVYNTK